MVDRYHGDAANPSTLAPGLTPTQDLREASYKGRATCSQGKTCVGMAQIDAQAPILDENTFLIPNNFHPKISAYHHMHNGGKEQGSANTHGLIPISLLFSIVGARCSHQGRRYAKMRKATAPLLCVARKQKCACRSDRTFYISKVCHFLGHHTLACYETKIYETSLRGYASECQRRLRIATANLGL